MIASGKTEELLELFNQTFDQVQFSQSHNEAYEPTYYFLESKGKRIRPLLLMLSCDMFGGSPSDSLNPAFGIELFHNFTLIHDDIMDEADIRRGKPTVHEKYTEGTAILTGDFLMILAYRYVAKVRPEILDAVLSVFNQTATQIIEGQVMDAAFESTDDVNEDDYLRMIGYKTSVLLAASLKIGAIIGGASAKDQQLIYDFGKYLGLAFQVKDDLLDVFGDKSLGKKIGGDILRNKKTYLFIKAWNAATTDEKSQLTDLRSTEDDESKIQHTIDLYRKLRADRETESLMDELFKKAIDCLNKISISENKKSDLLQFANKIYHREY